MKTAEQVLEDILQIVRQYLPPDGIGIHPAMSEIIGCVDPWPLASPPPPAAPVAAEPRDEMDLVCYSTPPGWRCTRGAGHDGPCAAVKDSEELSLVARGMQRLREGTQAAPLPAEQLQEQALRGGIADLMSQCTEKQNAFLHQLHDGASWRGLANCPADKLSETYELLRRTVLSKDKP